MANGDLYGVLTVTSLPANPNEGQVVDFLADAAARVVWRLKYNAASGKWDVIGAQPLIAEIDTSQSTSSAAYVDLATVGPSITTPLAGDYDLTYGGRLSGVSNDYVVMGPSVGGAAPAAADELVRGNANPDLNVMRSRKKAGLAISTVIKLQYRTSNAAAAATFAHRRLMVTPLRIG